MYLRWYALLVPMLYCDAIVDAVNKGLGQQRICVGINIFTSVMDVVGLYFLLPLWGMKGYFLSFLISHAVNAALSIALLLKATQLRVPLSVLLLTAASALVALMLSSLPSLTLIKAGIFLLSCFGFLVFTEVLRFEDILWLLELTGIKKRKKKTDFLKNNI